MLPLVSNRSSFRTTTAVLVDSTYSLVASAYPRTWIPSKVTSAFSREFLQAGSRSMVCSGEQTETVESRGCKESRLGMLLGLDRFPIALRHPRRMRCDTPSCDVRDPEFSM